MPKDEFLQQWLARVDRLRGDGEVTHAARVIPVGESLPVQQWVLPGEQALEFVRQARTTALIPCECRTHYGHCSNPTELCIVLDGLAERHIAEGSGRGIAVDEAAAVLREAEALGLVHLAIYTSGQRVSAVCNCCPCCCHNLQPLKRYGRADLVAHSEYVAATDMDACTHCGDCIARCPFDARVWDGSEMRYDATACYGCGLCVTACASGATTLRPREES